MNNEILEKIRHELVTIDGLYAIDYDNPNCGYVSLPVEDLIKLDYTDLITEFDTTIKSIQRLTYLLQAYYELKLTKNEKNIIESIAESLEVELK